MCYDAVDVNGQKAIIEMVANYIPDLAIPLFSPQQYCQFHQLNQSDKPYYGGNVTSMFLETVSGDVLRFPIHFQQNLPILMVKPDTSPCEDCASHTPSESCANRKRCQAGLAFSASFLTVMEETNQNLTRPQKELLLWHHHLGHIGFKHLQALMTRCIHADKKL